jgi:hypothetical protein
MLKVKTKDELIIALEKELGMKEYLMRNYEENKTLVDVCTGRIESLKFALGFDELNKEEK